jgi:ATP/maltotriose-dependent transcriptional regulator MalT
MPLLTQAIELTAREMVAFQAFCHLSLGEAQVLSGRLEEAHALAEHTLGHAREHEELGDQAYALHLLGDITAIHMYRTMEMSLWLPPAEATLAQLEGRSQR